ncbi:hypothetical protein [Algivirga pacifica]|uniref:Alginate export domain-containing protein n=1 Tax=Algivirga pacifica TaxID=1162670 RepID=A0ABP9CZM4_9BACT
MNKIILKTTFLLGLLFSVFTLQAQEEFQEEESTDKPSNIYFGGYLKYLQTIGFQELNDRWITDNLIHNRLNFKWYASSQVTVVAEMRNRLFYGETVTLTPNYADIYTANNNWLDLGGVWWEGESVVGHSTLDRAYIDWTFNDWQIRAGRQRVNWGQTFAWNPNDIFNNYSLFDFDYEERPGMDGLLVRKYIGMVSSVELAVAMEESFEDMTIAGMYRFNQWAYDFQVLAGKMRKDWVVGGGWSGQIGGAGFKGEASYFYPIEQDSESVEPAVVATMSTDYTFPNTLFVSVEGIFNSGGGDAMNQNILALGRGETPTPRTLTLNKWSILGQASYQINPLVNAGMSSIYFIDDNSAYFTANTNISLSTNTELLLATQAFVGGEDSQFGQSGVLLFWRLKWSF